MQWNSASEFFAMGGYGLYVWGSFGACALLMAIEPLAARHRHLQALRELAREELAEQLSKETATP
jgi:heme exporter protein D